MNPNTDVEHLSSFELEALREVSSIGAGHAATALSQMTGTTVLITVPEFDIVHITRIPKMIEHLEEPMAGLYMRVVGNGQGAILLSFRRRAALNLVNLMMGQLRDSAHHLSELEQSALREAGNIIAGAFLTAISNFLDVVLLPSVPRLAFDMGGALVQSLLVESKVERDYAFVMHIHFQGQQRDIDGHFLMVADAQTMAPLVRSIRELSRGVG